MVHWTCVPDLRMTTTVVLPSKIFYLFIGSPSTGPHETSPTELSTVYHGRDNDLWVLSDLCTSGVLTFRDTNVTIRDIWWERGCFKTITKDRDCLLER